MDDHTRAERYVFDALTTDPSKRALFTLLYQLDAMVRAQTLAAATQAAISDLLDQALEAVRLLP
jgi:predicted acetyltransferase